MRTVRESVRRLTPHSTCGRDNFPFTWPETVFMRTSLDLDTLRPASLRHSGTPAENRSDVAGFSEREHSTSEITQHVYVREEGWEVAEPGSPCAVAQSSNVSSSALHPPSPCSWHKSLPSSPSDMKATSCRRPDKPFHSPTSL